MKQLLLFLLLLALTLQAQQNRPNIILLMGDDHGWEEVGYNGHPLRMSDRAGWRANAGWSLLALSP